MHQLQVRADMYVLVHDVWEKGGLDGTTFDMYFIFDQQARNYKCASRSKGTLDERHQQIKFK